MEALAGGGLRVERAIGVLGLAVLLAIAWAASVERRAIPWRSVAIAMGLQLAIAALALKTRAGAAGFEALRVAALAFIGAADRGIDFVFGPQEMLGAGGERLRLPFAFAVRVLPVIVFMSSVFALLYHVRVLPLVVRALALGLRRVLPVSGAEALSAAGNVFLGMTEAPLLVRPYVAAMTRSELFCVMSVGLANIAGSVLVAYADMLGPGFVGHLVTASLMSTPGAIAFAKMIVPESGSPQTGGDAVPPPLPRTHANAIDAAAAGASEGLYLALNVGAMLIAFVAILALLDSMLASSGAWVGLPGLSFGRLLGTALAPLAWLLGVPWADAPRVGELLGVKTVLNEFLAYQQLGALRDSLQPRSVLIASYALCGFANLGSLAILLGGLGGMAPERRPDIARDGLRAILAGTLASFATGAVVGLLL
jgi:CNT family concentrative nucleoside transporter